MWYPWKEQRIPLKRWKDLKSLILENFRPFEDEDLYEQWMGVEQTRSMVEYRKEFVTKLTHLQKMAKFVMLGAFLRGLREEVKAEIWSKQCCGLRR